MIGKTRDLTLKKKIEKLEIRTSSLEWNLKKQENETFEGVPPWESEKAQYVSEQIFGRR